MCINYSSVETFKSEFALADKAVACLLMVSVSTLSRRKKQGKLLEKEVLRYELLDSTFKQASECFGSIEHAKNWLIKPARALAGKTPFECMTSSEGGLLQVHTLLTQLEYGVYP